MHCACTVHDVDVVLTATSQSDSTHNDCSNPTRKNPPHATKTPSKSRKDRIIGPVKTTKIPHLFIQTRVANDVAQPFRHTTFLQSQVQKQWAAELMKRSQHLASAPHEASEDQTGTAQGCQYCKAKKHHFTGSTLASQSFPNSVDQAAQSPRSYEPQQDQLLFQQTGLGKTRPTPQSVHHRSRDTLREPMDTTYDSHTNHADPDQ